MRTTAASLKDSSVVSSHSLLASYAQLTKARLTFLVVLTTFAGFYMAGGRLSWLLFHLLFGTALVAAGSAILNQLLEYRWDAKMHRTQDRPIPAGRIHPKEALILGFSSSICGLGYLLYFTNLLTALLAGVTLGSYLYLYTPLKRYTPLNTLVGAIPGALPPVLGWTAVQNTIDLFASVLFLILFFWQLPHFLAIAWLYREDYQRAEFKMLAGADPSGRATGRQAFLYSAALLPLSLLPWVLGACNLLYFVGAFALGSWLIGLSIFFARNPDKKRARQLFLASVLYLPLLLFLMCLCKVSL